MLSFSYHFGILAHHISKLWIPSDFQESTTMLKSCLLEIFLHHFWIIPHCHRNPDFCPNLCNPYLLGMVCATFPRCAYPHICAYLCTRMAIPSTYYFGILIHSFGMFIRSDSQESTTTLTSCSSESSLSSGWKGRKPLRRKLHQIRSQYIF